MKEEMVEVVGKEGGLNSEWFKKMQRSFQEYHSVVSCLSIELGKEFCEFLNASPEEEYGAIRKEMAKILGGCQAVATLERIGSGQILPEVAQLAVNSSAFGRLGRCSIPMQHQLLKDPIVEIAMSKSDGTFYKTCKPLEELQPPEIRQFFDGPTYRDYEKQIRFLRSEEVRCARLESQKRPFYSITPKGIKIHGVGVISKAELEAALRKMVK